MNKKLSALALAVLCGASLTLKAQDAPPHDGPPQDGPPHGGPGGHHRPVPPIIAALDVNKDGIIDASEIANAVAALKTLDKNGDGQLTQDELRPAPPHDVPHGGPQDGSAGGPPEGDRPPHGPDGSPAGRPGRPPEPPIMAALDVNHDGIIDATELANAVAALKTLDKNGDGKLTPDELRPARPGHRPPPGQ